MIFKKYISVGTLHNCQICEKTTSPMERRFVVEIRQSNKSRHSVFICNECLLEMAKIFPKLYTINQEENINGNN